MSEAVLFVHNLGTGNAQANNGESAADVSSSERVNDDICQQLFSLNSTEGGIEYQREDERLQIFIFHWLKFLIRPPPSGSTSSGRFNPYFLHIVSNHLESLFARCLADQIISGTKDGITMLGPQMWWNFEDRERSRVYVITGGTHREDTMPPSSRDSTAMRDARVAQLNAIKEWLGMENLPDHYPDYASANNMAYCKEVVERVKLWNGLNTPAI